MENLNFIVVSDFRYIVTICLSCVPIHQMMILP